MKTVIILILLWLTQFTISNPIDNCNQYHCNAEQFPNSHLCICIECKDVCNPYFPNTECALQHNERRCLNFTDGPLLREVQDTTTLWLQQNRTSESLLDGKNSEKKNNDGINPIIGLIHCSHFAFSILVCPLSCYRMCM